MLSDKNAAVTIAVKDTKAAKKFYEEVLGLKPVPSRELGVLNYKSGNSSILVYESR
jgi:catechol 2,3-dioxygenase-like lactoylglutathione lyase family enzyme